MWNGCDRSMPAQKIAKENCSPVSCFVHLLRGLIAYCDQPKKLSLNLATLGIERFV